MSLPEGGGEGEAGGGGEGGGVHPHHSLNMGVNDVATLVLEDNQGITYDFYTFQVGFFFVFVRASRLCARFRHVFFFFTLVVG